MRYLPSLLIGRYLISCENEAGGDSNMRKKNDVAEVEGANVGSQTFLY